MRKPLCKYKKKIGKRGFFDLIYIIIILFILGVTILLAKLIVVKFNETAQPAINASSARAAKIMVDVENKTVPQFDKIFFGAMIGAQLGVLLLSYKLKSSPAFYFLGVLFVMITVLISAIFSNVFEEIRTTAELNTISSSGLPIMNYIWSRMPLLIGAFGVVVLVVTYAMGRSEYG